MAVAFSQKTEFTINQVRFSTYNAQDAHGTRVDHFHVDGKLLPYKDFCAAIAAAMDTTPGAQSVIAYALIRNNVHRYCELGSSMRQLKKLEDSYETEP